MTATHARPEAGAGGSSAVQSRQGLPGRDVPGTSRKPDGRSRRPGGRGSGARDLLVLMLLPVPLVLAALPAAFAGGGTRRWFGGRGENERAEAQAAKDAAAEAF
ncbi:hypothetical protein G3M58_20290, partial [Streptomyces sp. SID7499]|nr:hypothetical protein [Streptomyces sp. SID7499]